MAAAACAEFDAALDDLCGDAEDALLRGTPDDVDVPITKDTYQPGGYLLQPSGVLRSSSLARVEVQGGVSLVQPEGGSARPSRSLKSSLRSGPGRGLQTKTGDLVAPAGVEKPKCSVSGAAGGDEGFSNVFDVGATCGSFSFSYQTYFVKDRVIVGHGGSTLLDTGCVGQSASLQLQLNPAARTSRVSVTVRPCEPGTAWNFQIGCASGGGPDDEGPGCPSKLCDESGCRCEFSDGTSTPPVQLCPSRPNGCGAKAITFEDGFSVKQLLQATLSKSYVVAAAAIIQELANLGGEPISVPLNEIPFEAILGDEIGCALRAGCDDHDQCYETCNESQENCDNRMSAIQRRGCNTIQGPQLARLPYSGGGVVLFPSLAATIITTVARNLINSIIAKLERQIRNAMVSVCLKVSDLSVDKVRANGGAHVAFDKGCSCGDETVGEEDECGRVQSCPDGVLPSPPSCPAKPPSLGRCG